jgi:hypothetical protein
MTSDSFINTTLDSLSHHDGQTDNESLSFSPEMLRVKTQNQRSRQRYQSNTHTNDINPRKHSPIPISPPTNIEFEQTIDKSIEAILNNQQHNPSNQMDDKLIRNMNQMNPKHLFDKLFKEFKGQVLVSKHNETSYFLFKIILIEAHFIKRQNLKNHVCN